MIDTVPFISIVVPTRNRSAPLRRALASIAAQTCRDFEVVVVDDGSQGEHLEAMRALASEFDERFVFLWRAPDAGGHGPSYSRNLGIENARGRYIGFLDDDDYWCDVYHLERAQECARAMPDMDAYFANQVAKRESTVIVPDWLPYLERVKRSRRLICGDDIHELRRQDLLQPEGIGFAHVNISIYSSELLRAIQGFSTISPYEEDLDFFLRAVNRAQKFAYRSATVSVNTLRSTAADSGVSSIAEDSKRLYRMLVCQHVLLRCEQPDVRAYARLLMAGVLKSLSKRENMAGHYGTASDFASQSIGIDPSLRWFIIALGLKLRSLLPLASRTSAIG